MPVFQVTAMLRKTEVFHKVIVEINNRAKISEYREVCKLKFLPTVFLNICEVSTTTQHNHYSNSESVAESFDKDLF